MQRARIVTRLAPRALDWFALSNKMTGDVAKSEVTRLSQLAGEITAKANAAAVAPAAIDFAGFKSSITSPGVVGAFESSYNGLSYPSFGASAECQAIVAESESAYTAAVACAQSAVAASEARV